jgi:Carbohydrate-selective porin, OprB family
MRRNFNGTPKKGDPGLDGKLKLGGWRHFGSFTDERFDTAGLSLADPASSGTAASFNGDYGLYAVFEQKLYRVGSDDGRGIGVFARASYSPPADNLIDVYTDAGLEFIGLSDRRQHDKFGIATAYAHVSPRAQALDRDFQSIYGPSWPLRSSETLLTAVYQYEVQTGLTPQPNVQLIHHPGGGATDPLGLPSFREKLLSPYSCGRSLCLLSQVLSLLDQSVYQRRNLPEAARFHDPLTPVKVGPVDLKPSGLERVPNRRLSKSLGAREGRGCVQCSRGTFPEPGPEITHWARLQ